MASSSQDIPGGLNWELVLHNLASKNFRATGACIQAIVGTEGIDHNAGLCGQHCSSARTVAEIRIVLDGLQKQWKMTNLGEISHILGLKVTRYCAAKKIWLTQHAYFDAILKRFPGQT